MRSLRAFLVVLLSGPLLATAAPAAGVAGFGDVEDGRYFTTPVQWMVDEEITTGTSPSCFSPHRDVTRAEAAAFLWRMKGKPAADAHSFADVTKDWQQGPISWLAAEGITTGTTATTFSPDGTLTRGQFAALLHRLAGEPTGAPAHPFVDVVRGWQEAPVAWLFADGITTGTSDTEFSPDDPVTRGQIAAFLHRYQGSPAVTIDPSDPQCGRPTPGDGFDSLFIGHSFFRPMAEQMAVLAPMAGFDEHTQTVVFSGGATGAPQGLWIQDGKREQILDVLDTGEVELFGMTYHPTHPTLEGYQNFIDHAVAANPDTIVFIAIPWLTDPVTYTAATYAASIPIAYAAIGPPLVDELRARYPNTEIFAIPYGLASGELYSLYDAGELDADLSELVGSNGSVVYRDDFGHADHILEDLSSLIWLRAIYDVDLSTFDAGYDWTTDLNAIADRILDEHDSAYDAPWR
ncbi:MAG: S-layer homology domain-containing protein [Actinomycetota bacterium]